MRVLILWDKVEETELIQLYLSAAGGEPEFCNSGDEFITQAMQHGPWDAILLPLSFPDTDSAFELFIKIQEELADTPIIGAADQQEIYHVARFLTKGLRSYVVRDQAKDFVFLLHAAIQGAIEAIKREKEQFIARQLRQEVDSVRKLQQSILPDNLVNPEGYEIYGRYEPAQIRVVGGTSVTLAGGDYYNAYSFAKDSVVLIVGDASGHGIKACMSIMTMHTLIGMMGSEKFRNTSHFVTKVNNQLCAQSIVNGDGGFITMLYGVLNTKKHTFEWTSAGHPQPILFNKLTREFVYISAEETSGIPLAIYEDADYEMHKITIPPHHQLLLITDGLVEAFNPQDPDDKGFGMNGIQRVLVESTDLTPEALVMRLFDLSMAHTAGHGRHDDTSVLCIERH